MQAHLDNKDSAQNILLEVLVNDGVVNGIGLWTAIYC